MSSEIAPLPVATFIETLRQHGVKLWLVAGRLTVRAPRDVLTPALETELRERRDEIVAHLTPGAVTAIPSVPDAPAYELSHGQRRLWLTAQMDGGSHAYHVGVAVRLDGPLDVRALETAFAALGARHEALRTVFPTIDGGPRQRIDPQPSWSLARIDCAPDAVLRRCSELASEPFDLAHGPLFRPVLFRVDDAHHVLAIVMHHIVTDGWSIGILARELGELYAAARRGEAPNLDAPRLRYRDVAAWQQTNDANDRDFWLDLLRRPPPPLELPADRPRATLRRFRGGMVTVAFSAAERADLDRFAAAHRATLFMVLCAVVKVLLYRYTGERDVLLGTPVAGRTHPELEPIVGFFLNTIVIRSPLDPAAPFVDAVAGVRQATLDAYAHAAFPFDALVEALDPVRDPSRSPLFDVQISLQNAGSLDLRLPGITATPIDVDVPNSKYDLAFDFDLAGGELLAGIRFDSDLFDEARVRDIGERLRRLARAAVATPGTPCGRLDAFAPGELAEIERAGTGPSLALPAGTILDVFRAAAAARPEHVAVRCGDAELSYAQLDRRSDRIAAALAAAGAVPGEAIGVAVDRSVDLLAALLGVLKAGCAYVPIDPAYPAERLRQMIEVSGARTIVADGVSVPRLRPLLAASGARPSLADVAELAAAAAPPAARTAEPQQLAYVIFTSGSTGRPKGVEIEHGALLNFVLSMRASLGIGPADVLLAVSTISFDVAALELFLPICTGATVEIAPSDGARDAYWLSRRLRRGGITLMQATPSLWQMLVLTDWEGDSRLSALCGGEPFPVALAAALRQRCGRVWNLYGPTETTIWSSLLRVASAGPGPYVPLGAPIANTRIMVLDAALVPTLPGAAGEVYIGGSGVARGYRADPERTAAVFVRDPYAPGERMYRTGDVARRRADGSIEFVARADFQFKIRGHRVEAGDVEAALLRFPGIAEAVVSAVERDAGGAVLVAYLVAADGAVDEPALRAFLAELLPGYMVPTAYVRLPALPRAANGKIDRRGLPVPELARPEAAAPRTALEAQLVEIWRRVLGNADVGIEDDFFALGGQSLKAMQIAFAIQTELAVKVALGEVFERPTVASLAALVAERRERAAHV